MVEMTGLDNASLVSFSSISPFCFAKDGLCRFKSCRKFKELKIDTTKIYSKKLTITTRNRVVAKQSRCEGVYNRTGDLSVTCFGKEERRRE